MAIRKTRHNKNKLKSLWVIIPAVTVSVIIGAIAAVLISDAVKADADKQKFMKLDREMSSVYEEVKAIDPSISWQYDKGCVARPYFDGGVEYCFVRLASMQEITAMQTFINSFKVYEQALHNNSQLKQVESSDWTINKYDANRLQVSKFRAIFKHVSTNTQCDLTSSLSSDEDKYGKDGTLIDPLPAKGILEIDCSSQARDFWFPKSNKTYSTFE